MIFKSLTPGKFFLVFHMNLNEEKDAEDRRRGEGETNLQPNYHTLFSPMINSLDQAHCYFH